MAERKAVTMQMARRYERACKKEKGQVLDELCALTGWSRRHARRALTGAIAAKARAPKPPAPRPRLYGPEVLEALKFVWATLNGPAGKRLHPFMQEIVQALERSGELELDAGVRAKLVQVSAATIDRMLAPERRRLQVRGRSGTKPGSILQIPIRTFAEWDEASPGFCEVDLVAHDGGNPFGEFCHTLDLTCVNTGWTEVRALPNKAQRWCFEALKDIRRDLPFALRGIDSDNGSEFINDQLYRYCTSEGITFTRSRPYRKNDNCFVEQKNWPVVRQQVGYGRYDTAEELACLNDLYSHLRSYVNFFQPQMKLVAKTRHGAKVTKRYDAARTPYRRVMNSAFVGQDVKDELTLTYLGLNPAELKRRITACQDRLMVLARTKTNARREVRNSPDHPFRRTFSPRELSRTFSMRQPGGASRTS